MLTAIRESSADLNSNLQQAAARNDSALESGLSGLHRLDSEAKNMQKAMLDIVTRIDEKPPVDLDPLQNLVEKIDSKPPVDLQPFLDAVSAIELNPVIQTDLRSVIDAMNVGLANIEMFCAQLDTRNQSEVINMIKKIDMRVLEAIVKIDAKDPTRSSNFLWSTQANKWT